MSYSNKEVRGLVENYTALRDGKNNHGAGLTILVLMADLDRAISHLPPKEYQAVLLHGQMRHTVREAEQVLEIRRSTLHDRYEAGIAWITKFLNEGDDDKD